MSSDSGLRMPRLVIQPSDSVNEELFPLKYVFKDVVSACLLITCDAYSIILNQSIDNLQSAENHLKENRDLAEAICMSADYCSQAGYCGSLVMIFSLPIASSSLLATYRGWAQVRVKQFSGKLDALRIQPDLLYIPD